MIEKYPLFNLRQNNTIISVYHAEKGEGIPKHSHAYSHLTICCAGSCVVRKENKQLVMTKNTQPVNLVAEEWHEIEAIENGTVFINIFSEQNEI